MRKLLCLIGFLTLAGLANALPSATRLYLCAALPCPHPVPTLPPLTIASGATFTLYVIAADTLAVDETYTGTIHFASSDPLATLPPSYTFVAADRGRKAFTAVLRSPAIQTITVTDPENTLTRGVLAIAVITGGQFPDPIPTISPGVQVILALALGSAGIWLLRRNG